MMKGYMLFVIACSIHSITAIGEDCTHNDNCTETGQVCETTCVCYTDNNYYRTGDKCVKDIDDCSPNLCWNGGTCTDQVNGYTCSCVTGYTGDRCQTDIDDCSPNPCWNGGTCTDKVNGYTCSCVLGYTGNRCQTNIDDCSPNPCWNGGTCTDQVNGYTCSCVNGYTGDRCQINIDDCSPNPCVNGGTCTDKVNGYICSCVLGYTGNRCQTNVDDCSPDPCLNGGICTDRVNNFSCSCRAGYLSKTCSVAALGVSCAAAGTTCKDANAVCGTGSICVCRSSYYNDNGLSSGGTCRQMSAMPGNLQITDVTSRSFLISWDKPLNTFSDENYGYVLQVKDEQDRCEEEVLYRCWDCTGTFPTSEVFGLCSPNKQSDFYKTSAELASQLSYNASLNPDINYTVTVTAITDEGRGYPVTVTQRTKEEVPQTPYDVKVVGKTATTFDITWNINGPRPGQTTYVIILTADAPAESKNFTATGFALSEYKAFGLQEYWNYSVTVMASTSVGSRKSAVTNEYRTSPADEDFTKMKISWEMPTILERNGVIKSYRFENYEPGNVTATTNFQQNRLGYTYTKTVIVVPEEQYTFRVFAINEQNMEGEHIMVTKMAPPGVPLNIEESLLLDVIDLQREKTGTEKQITITLVREFFEESTNGKVQTTGLVVCVNSCDFEGVMTIIDVNAMENWTGASKKGLTSYRATKSDWLHRAKTQCPCGRNKREVTNIEFIVGSEDCKNVSPDEFCNGPLQPGTSYKFVAFTCTNGGCLLSRQYGPFTTANADTHCPECYTTNTHAVIVGVVLGLIIIILLLYAGYATYLIRRYRAKDEQEIKFKKRKDRKSQTYVNETFMTGSTSNTSENLNVDSGVENIYSRLDDNAREDKTTYESLRP